MKNLDDLVYILYRKKDRKKSRLNVQFLLTTTFNLKPLYLYHSIYPVTYYQKSLDVDSTLSQTLGVDSTLSQTLGVDSTLSRTLHFGNASADEVWARSTSM